jgi:pimeloyl-ACP methyl ester carboxylesterase
MMLSRSPACKLTFGTLLVTALAACGGDGDDSHVVVEDIRPQDARSFTPVPEATFPVLLGSAVNTDRWSGVLNGATYRIEVPKNWNGKLVMWAHGYAGQVPELSLDSIEGTPIMRRYLLDNGYAWAASSYSKNYYDVRAGVEDTNALALNFNAIAANKGRLLPPPTKVFIAGVSMGGHVAAAAVETETQVYAVNKVRYSGSVPMCAVLADTELFNYFAGYQVAAQQLANAPITAFPVADFAGLAPTIQNALWSSFPRTSNAQGNKLKNIVMNLSGGARPFYAEGWADEGNQGNIWASLGDDGSIAGILNSNVLDTTQLFYKVDDSSPTITLLDTAFNNASFKIRPTLDANRLRRDGLRWIPAVNGEVSVPVVTLHTLGDLFVPFKMQQLYLQRMKAKRSDQWLVQRAVRDVGHCAFTAAEAAAAFDAMTKWEAGGTKPAGDDVMVVASPLYGCAHTNSTPSFEDYTPPAVRAGYQANYPACP